MKYLILMGVLLTGAARADDPGPSFGSRFVFTEQGGAAIYAYVCAGCHMDHGRGANGAGRYPALAGDANLAAPGYAIGRVLHGYKAMPGFGRMLTDAQIADVVAFIQTHFGNEFPNTPSAADVAAAR